MNITILNLISRMSDNAYRPGQLVVDGVFESDKTVYAEAYEEVRHLNRGDLLDDLYSYLDVESDCTKRQHAYFIIGNIAKNLKDLDATKYLVKALVKEQEKNTLVTILNLLPDLFKPLEIDLSPIYKLTSNRNWHVRCSSFAALTNTENKVEDFLINKLRETDNKDDIKYLLYAIQNVGTKKSLAVVEPHLKNRTPSIKSTAHTVAALIMIREGFSDIDISKKLKLPTPSILIQTLKERVSLLTKPG
ncbi:MAG: hypothetical protein EOO46_12265 [Flavobacterium sp.]|nr:MAG: hypothetical protein EOO46_12265 [Flavobacterium sp.]